MGRSLESPVDPPSTDRLPVEIGLPPVDTRGEHVFAIFGRKEWIKKKKFFDFHQQFSKYHLLDLKTCQNTKAFALISGRVGDIL